MNVMLSQGMSVPHTGNPDVLESAAGQSYDPSLIAVLDSEQSYKIDIESAIMASTQTKGVEDVPAQVPTKRLKSRMFAQHYVTKQTLLIPSMFVAFLFVWTIGWLYFGAVWGPLGRLNQLPIGVMVCDTGLTAQQAAVLRAGGILPASSTSNNLGQVLLDSSIFNSSSPASQNLKWTAIPCSCPDDSTGAACKASLEGQLMDDGDFWAMLYVPHEFSGTLMSWATAGAGSAAAPPAFTFTYTQGRHYSTYSAITRAVETVSSAIAKSLAAQAAGAILRTPSLASQINPRFLVTPFNLQENNLNPISNIGQSMWTYLVLILVYLGATYVASAKSPLQLSTESAVVKKLAARGHTTVRRAQGIVLLVANGLTSYVFELFLVVLLMCIWLALNRGSPDNQKIQFVGHDMGYTLAFLWYFSFSLVHINYIFLHLFGDRFTAPSSVFLILNLVSSGGVWPHELQGRFYKIGVALPFYYARQGLSTIFFGGFESKMPLNWGILTAWNVATLLLSMALGLNRFMSRTREQLKGVQKVHVDATQAVTTVKASETQDTEGSGLSLPLPPRLSRSMSGAAEIDNTDSQQGLGVCVQDGEVEEQTWIGKHVGTVALMGA